MENSKTGIENELYLMYAAGINFVWILGSGDERRAEEAVQKAMVAAREEGLLAGGDSVYLTWDCTTEMVTHQGAYMTPQGEWDYTVRRPLEDPVPVTRLMQTLKDSPPGFYFLRDIGTILNSREQISARRRLIEAAKNLEINNSNHGACAFIFHTEPPCAELKEHVRIVEFPHPTIDDLKTTADQILQFSTSIQITPEFRDRAARAVTGLSMAEADTILSLATTVTKSESSFLERVSHEKAKALRSSEGLEFTPLSDLPDPDDLAGFENFKDWMVARRHAYSAEAVQFKVPFPRGVLIVGVPGTGKSVMAKAGAKLLGLDLVEMDFGAMFGRFVGESESRLRSALKTIEAMGDVYVCLDEIDKSLGGADKGQASDGGTGSRMLGYLLTWMADRDRSRTGENRTFIMATANRLDVLPPPLIRAGRFDRIFYTTLPTPEEAFDILGVHLHKFGLNIEDYDEKKVRAMLRSKDCSKRTGAEIAQAVSDAVILAYHRDSQNYGGPTVDDLAFAMKAITPISKTMSDEISRIEKDIAKNGLTPVSLVKEESTKSGGGKLVRPVWNEGLN